MRHLGLLFLVFSLQSCLMVGVDKIDAVEGFDWDTLKRDLIVMTPLMDLRKDVVTPPGFEKDVAAFSEKEILNYPEIFKRIFFEYRKDIRVFGAGGAFENISKIPGLSDMARKVLAKETLSPDEQKLLNDSRQDKRFIFFFNFTDERLDFEYSLVRPSEAKGLYVEKNYDAKRTMTLKLALWDSQVAQTVFVLEKTLTPMHRNQFLIRTGLSPKAVKGDKGRYESAREPDFYDLTGRGTLEEELRVHSARFPASFPKREPTFRGSFKHFALTLPIKKSEQNLIEYDNFTNHRPELTWRSSALGKESFTNYYLGTSSRIYNFYRIGGGLVLFSNKPELKYGGETFIVDDFCLCLTMDLEWDLSNMFRVMTGSMLGAGSLMHRKKGLVVPEGEDDPSKKEDGYYYAAPRIKFILGPKQGLQLGLGVFQQFYSGLIEPVILENKPSRWGADLTLSLQFRGF